MIRYLAFIGLAGLVLVTGIAFAASSRRVDKGPVYTVAEVRAHLADKPGAWVGRTVLVRGLAEACLGAGSWGDLPLFQSCSRQPPSLADSGSAGASESLPLIWGTQSRLAWLRRVPLVSGLVPPALTPRWWTLATYRVQLQRAPDRLCGVTACYEALLLGAAP